MPNDTSMIFNIITRDGSSPAFRTVAAEAKALAAAMAEADAKMTTSTRATTASINASMAELGRAHSATAMQYDRATAQEIGANDSLATSQKKLALSMQGLVAEQRAAAASAVETGATIDRVSAEEAAATEASAAKRKASMMAFGAASALALTGVAYYSVKAATAFEASMARVQTMAGSSAAELKAMSAGVLDLAPKVGVGPEKLAESLYHVESAGFHGAKALDMVAASAKLSAIGQDDINSSTQAVVATLASNIKGVRDANDAAAQILHTVGTGDMTMHQFTQALGTGLLATAAAVGLSFRDVGAAIATMTDNAIPADQAATKLRTSLLMMVNPSKPAAAALASIGMNSTALAGDLQKPDGLKVALDDIRTHLDATFPKNGGIPLTIGAQRAAVASYRQELATAGVQGKELNKAVNAYADSLKHGTTNTVLQEQAFAKMFGGSKNAGTMLVLFNEQLDRMDPKLASFGDATSRAAELQAAWAKQQDTFKQKLNQLSAAFDVMKIKIGNALLPVLKEVIGFMGSHIGTVEALAFAIGTVLVGATVAWTVALQTNPVVLFVEALALVGVEIYELITHFKEITHWLSGPWGTAISIAVAAVFPFIGIPMLIMGHWRGLLTFFKAVWRDMSHWAVDAWHVINPVARDIGGAAQAVGRFFQRMGSAVMGAIAATVSFVSRHWRLLITIFLGPIGFIISAVYRFRQQIGGVFESLWRTVSGFAGRMWRDVTGWTSRIWHDGVTHFSRMWRQIADLASRIWHDTAGLFSDLYHSVTGWTSRIWHDGADHFVKMWRNLTDTAGRILHDVSQPFQVLWSGLKSGFDTVVAGIKTAWDKLHDIFAVPIRFLMHYVYDDGIVKVWNAVMNVLGEKGRLPTVDYNHFAQGGVVPGNHNRDDVPIFVTPGEGVITKAGMQKIGGPDTLAAINGQAVSGGAFAHAANGLTHVLGDVGHALTHNPVTDVLGDAVKALAGLVRGALADTAGPVLNGAISLAGRLIPGADHGWGKTSVDLSHKMVDKVMDWIRGQDAKDQAAMAVLGGPAYDGSGNAFVGGVGLKGLNLEFFNRLTRMAQGTGHHINVNSGFRSMASQAALYARYLAGTGNLAAKPGSSNHEKGLAADIAPGREVFGGVAGRYQLMFPIPSEAWHIEPVRNASLAGSGAYSGFSGGGPAGEGSVVQQVHRAAIARGWGGQLGALDYIINRESSYNPNVGNPSSSAFGLFQLLYGGHGSVAQQIVNGFNYIAGRYGNPDNAERFWQSHHWYANGGMPPVGEPFWVGERGPELLRLGPGARGSRVYSNEESRQMVGGGGFHVHGDMIVQSDVDFETKLRQSEFRQQMANGF